MKEFIVLFTAFLIFLAFSYFFYVKMLKSKIMWVIFYLFIYIISIEILFELVNKLHIYLRNKQIYLEFGHASILLLEVNFLCLLIAVILIITIFYKRNKLTKG